MPVQIVDYLIRQLFCGGVIGHLSFILCHENWRDEAQAWLLARDLSIPELFEQMSYEGHPCLWHLLLMPLVRLGLPYISMALKPFPLGYLRAVRLMNVSRKETAAIGDQIFTDILGARWTGVRSILVTPQGEESVLRFGWRRRLEAPIRKKIQEQKDGKCDKKGD